MWDQLRDSGDFYPVLYLHRQRGRLVRRNTNRSGTTCTGMIQTGTLINSLGKPLLREGEQDAVSLSCYLYYRCINTCGVPNRGDFSESVQVHKV